MTAVTVEGDGCRARDARRILKGRGYGRRLETHRTARGVSTAASDRETEAEHKPTATREPLNEPHLLVNTTPLGVPLVLRGNVGCGHGVRRRSDGERPFSP